MRSGGRRTGSSGIAGDGLNIGPDISLEKTILFNIFYPRHFRVASMLAHEHQML